MHPIFSLVLALLFSFGLRRQIKKYPVIFYLLSMLLVLSFSLYYRYELYETFPRWFTGYVVDPFKRGAFSTALFILVMYTGALNSKWKVTQCLQKIRGELSIIACLITLGHNFVYGRHFFPSLILHPSELEPQHVIATCLTLVMLSMMLPLMITSFQGIRKKMKAQTWKKVQKLAYPFFALIYIHIMVLFIPKAEEKWLEIVVYTVVFASYAVLRITKAAKSRSALRPKKEL